MMDETSFAARVKLECKSCKDNESYVNSPRIDGLELSGQSRPAALLPQRLKFDPRCGVPKKRMALVCAIISACDISWLA
jgi:hypothetical protein